MPHCREGGVGSFFSLLSGASSTLQGGIELHARYNLTLSPFIYSYSPDLMQILYLRYIYFLNTCQERHKKVRLERPWSYLDFAKYVECSGSSNGLPLCYDGLSWLKFSVILGSAPVCNSFFIVAA